MDYSYWNSTVDDSRILIVYHLHLSTRNNFNGTIISYANNSVLFFESDNWNLVKHQVEIDVSLLKKIAEF